MVGSSPARIALRVLRVLIQREMVSGALNPDSWQQRKRGLKSLREDVFSQFLLPGKVFDLDFW